MPSWLCVALIPLCVAVFGFLGFLAVAFVEFLGAQEENLIRYLRPSGSPTNYLGSNWKPLMGGMCAAVLAGGSAAEFTFSSFGADAEKHPVLTSVVAGALLAVITVLVIEALVRSLASRAWEGMLTNTWHMAVRGARRGASDLRSHLGTGYRVTEGCLPEPGDNEARQAYEQAHALWIDLGERVSRASLAAFASDTPELGESMHELSTATDTLHRALKRYAANEPSESKGRPYQKRDIVGYWRDYVSHVLTVDQQGRDTLKSYSSPLSDAQQDWLKAERGDHTTSTSL